MGISSNIPYHYGSITRTRSKQSYNSQLKLQPLDKLCKACFWESIPEFVGEKSTDFMLALWPRKIEIGLMLLVPMSKRIEVWSPLAVIICHDDGAQQRSNIAFSWAWNPIMGLDFPTMLVSCNAIFPSSFASATMCSKPGDWANLHAYNKSELGAEFEVENIPGYSSSWWHFSLDNRKSTENFSFPFQNKQNSVKLPKEFQVDCGQVGTNHGDLPNDVVDPYSRFIREGSMF